MQASPLYNLARPSPYPSGERCCVSKVVQQAQGPTCFEYYRKENMYQPVDLESIEMKSLK